MYSFSVPNQSPWLVDTYNEYLGFKTDGFLVEIGVGHTLTGVDHIFEGTLENLSNIQRIGNNTADLLDLGWSGIYIEPVIEFCEEAKIAHANNLDRLSIINLGASDVDEELAFNINDTFLPNDFDSRGYPWVKRMMRLAPTSVILEDNNCPPEFDLMSIDVEGFEDRVLRGLDFQKHRPHLMIIEINIVNIDQINAIIPSYYQMVRNDSLNAVWIDTERL